jgi:Apoptosis-antagonizing transcription factor, C-terminal
MAVKKKAATTTKRAREATSRSGRDQHRQMDGDSRQQASPSSGGLFSAIRELDAEDSREEAKRRKRGHRLVEQSRAAQSQSGLYWSFVECRIVLQRSVAGLHKWQQQQQRLAASENRGASEASEDPSGQSSAEFVRQCDELLVHLLKGRRTLTRQQHATGSGEGQQDNDGEHDGAVDYASVLGTTANCDDAEHPTDQLENVLQSEYDELRENWRDVLNKRHSDVRLRSGLTSKSQFKVVDSTFWQQVEATAEHEHQHHQLRVSAAAARPPSAASGLHDDSRPTFDDSKVYQQLLKDFLSSHHGASGAAVTGEAHERLLRRRQREKGPRSSSSGGAAVDRKASKGRKIRYHDIPKLQHFTFPIARGHASSGGGGGGGALPAAATTTLLDEDEWFRSLFGGGAESS